MRTQPLLALCFTLSLAATPANADPSTLSSKAPAASQYHVVQNYPSLPVAAPQPTPPNPYVAPTNRNAFPWKTNIITTKFWIGEPRTPISPQNNVGSAWDQNWQIDNHGVDNPTHRDGYACADHATTINPFYVALPFNDIVYPEKALQWLPTTWYRKPQDGKEVSWCKDRWVEIRNARGRVCYAQWEDVGPLRSDHAEYVFGNERPNTYTHAGLDVSPAVAQYLGFDGSAITSWRFVSDDNVPPGEWLKYEELAVIYRALEEQKNALPTLPIQSTVKNAIAKE